MSCGSLGVTRINAPCVPLLNESCVTFIVRNPHKFSSGFLYWVVSKPKTPRKRTLPEKQPRFIQKIGVVFRGGSPFSGFLVRKPPNKETRKKPRGGFLYKKMGLFFSGVPFPPGPWFGNHPIKKPVRNPGGFLMINSSLHA